MKATEKLSIYIITDGRLKKPVLRDVDELELEVDNLRMWGSRLPAFWVYSERDTLNIGINGEISVKKLVAKIAGLSTLIVSILGFLTKVLPIIQKFYAWLQSQ